MTRILVIEDDVAIHNLISELLEKEKWEVVHAYSGLEVKEVLTNNQVDLILLDLMLPALNGEEIIKNIKNIPIIVISAKTSTATKTACLLKGANDYVTKPFDNEELIARIKVQIRLAEKKNTSLEYKDLKLVNNRLMIDKTSIHLTKTEQAILKQLLLTPEQVISKTKLLKLIASDTEDGDENSLKVHISNIRKKIKRVTKEEYIESVWGIGFKMKS